MCEHKFSPDLLLTTRVRDKASGQDLSEYPLSILHMSIGATRNLTQSKRHIWPMTGEKVQLSCVLTLCSNCVVAIHCVHLRKNLDTRTCNVTQDRFLRHWIVCRDWGILNQVEAISSLRPIDFFGTNCDIVGIEDWLEKPTRIAKTFDLVI